MTWSKAWTASEGVVDSDSLKRVINDFTTNFLTTRGWTVTEPPTDNATDGEDGVWGLEKQMELFGGVTYSHKAVLHYQNNATNSGNAVYAAWEGSATDPIVDGYPVPSSSRRWNSNGVSISYNASGDYHYGVWEAWSSDQDSESFIVFGGATDRNLIGFGLPAGTRFASTGTYAAWPVLGMPAKPGFAKLGTYTEYFIRPAMSPMGSSVLPDGTGPFLMNYPTISMYYSTSAYIFGRMSTNDWLEMSSVGSTTMTRYAEAVEYEGDNYIRVGGITSWLFNTGTTVPFA